MTVDPLSNQGKLVPMAQKAVISLSIFYYPDEHCDVYINLSSLKHYVGKFGVFFLLKCTNILPLKRLNFSFEEKKSNLKM